MKGCSIPGMGSRVQVRIGSPRRAGAGGGGRRGFCSGTTPKCREDGFQARGGHGPFQLGGQIDRGNHHCSGVVAGARDEFASLISEP